MSQQVTIEERLSALYDGEMSSFEGHRLTSELLANSKRKAKWLRYQMVSDVMRGEVSQKWDPGFANRVMQGIESDPAYAIQSTRKSSHAWLKSAAGLALAASVAAVSIFALQFATSPDSGLEMAATEPAIEDATAAQPQTLAELPQSTTTTDNSMVRQVNTTEIAPAVATTGTALTDPRMDSYLATHAEFASRPGFLSRVRIVGYSGSSPEEER